MIAKDLQKETGSTRIEQDTIFVELDNIRDLFIAPDPDPFSENETKFMGQSALERIITQLSPGWILRARYWQMIIRLPRDQITPGLSEQVNRAILRSCRKKIEDNRIQLGNVRWNGIRKLPFCFLFLATCIGLGSLFEAGAIPGVSEWMGVALSEGLTIIGWVSLTGPAEALLLDPLPLWRENRLLEILVNTPIEIQPAVSRD